VRLNEFAVDITSLDFGWPGQPSLLLIDQLRIARGERIFLHGPSGSGKSTLLSLIGGVLVPQSGSIRVLDMELQALRPSARDRYRGDHIGFIFQMFNLVPYLSVLANVLLPLRFSARRQHTLASGGAEQEAQRLLQALGLGAELASRPATALSIGQQQRVAAARALIGRPPLVIADEPTSALDSDTRAGFLDLLRSECRAAGTTLLFVSHDLSLATLFDRSLALRELNRAAASVA
jgi:putative ABC transport system ATP-binding protein